MIKVETHNLKTSVETSGYLPEICFEMESLLRSFRSRLRETHANADDVMDMIYESSKKSLHEAASDNLKKIQACRTEDILDEMLEYIARRRKEKREGEEHE